MIPHSVDIAFLFMSFKRLREREQIRQILLDSEQLTSDTSFTLEKLFLKRAEREAALLAIRDKSSCRESNFK